VTFSRRIESVPLLSVLKGKEVEGRGRGMGDYEIGNEIFD